MVLLHWLIGVPIGLVLCIFLYWRLWFLRDPEREIPDGNVIVSPADGKVMEIREVTLPGSAKKGIGEFNFVGKELGKKALMLSIFMSPLDVHYNRAPIAGEVTAIRYHKGGFHPADSERANENESNEIIIKAKNHTIGVVQVAGILARRIECFTTVGARVEKGERIGLINLGSRVTLLMPLKIKLDVAVGDKVKGGSTIIARL